MAVVWIYDPAAGYDPKQKAKNLRRFHPGGGGG